MEIINFKSTTALQEKLLAIGCDPASLKYMDYKGLRPTILLKNMAGPSALILKQEMLSLGGDAACHRLTLTAAIAKTDVLLLGNLDLYSALLKKLSWQPFGLGALAHDLQALLAPLLARHNILQLPSGRRLDLSAPRLMGILNCTPDSFSDGGQFNEVQPAAARGGAMLTAGADLIDIGGESSRPGATPVSVDQELQRVIPVIEALSSRALISIDTYKSSVARRALQAGAEIINDITALRDPQMAELAAATHCPIILMHMPGNPQTMQAQTTYPHGIMSALFTFFEERLNYALQAGIKEENIIIDPGIGFGKNTSQNLIIIRELSKLNRFGRPILLGPSRKSFIGQLLDNSPSERLAGTAAAICVSAINNAKLLRVHDVKFMREVLAVTQAVCQA